MPTVLDQTVLYLLHDWLSAHAEQVLTRTAVGFRRGVQMHNTVLNAHSAMAKRPFVAVVDIATFFDAIGWDLVDRVIGNLPADDDVQSLLKDLVRVEVVERRSGGILARGRGIPQGLSISPVIANLVLNEFDQGVAHAMSKFSTYIRRYCDDLLLAAPSQTTGDKGIGIINDRLTKLGLTVKRGTGKLVDTREELAVWLGISFGPNGLNVPHGTIEAKAVRLQAKLDQGVLDALGVDDSLMSLDQHYRRFIGPERSQGVIRSIKGELSFSTLPHTRKEGIDRLRELIGEHHHRGHISQGARPHGKPDDVDQHQIVRPAQEPREDSGLGRIDQW